MRVNTNIFLVFGIYIAASLFPLTNIFAASEADILKQLEALEAPIYIDHAGMYLDGGTLVFNFRDKNNKKFSFSLPAFGFDTIYIRRAGSEVKLTRDGKAEKLIIKIMQDCVNNNYILPGEHEIESVDYRKELAQRFLKYLEERREFEPIKKIERLTHTNNKYGYQIKHLNTWRTSPPKDPSKSGGYADIFNYFKPDADPRRFQGACNLAIAVYDSGGLSLESWLKQHQEHYINYDKEKARDNPRINIRFHENEELPYKISGKKAIVERTGHRDQEGVIVDYPDNRWDYIYIKHKKNIYCFNLFNVYEVLPEEEFLAETERMLKSFKFIPQ